MWTDENRARYDRSQLRYPSDLTDEEWPLIEPLIPAAKRGGNKRGGNKRGGNKRGGNKRGGNKRGVNIREVVNGLLYVLSTGCQWRAIPKDLPARSTVYGYC